jgi:hypothetical protein
VCSSSCTDALEDDCVDVGWVFVRCFHCDRGGKVEGRLSSSCCLRRCVARLRFLAIVLLLCLASLHKRTHDLGDERSGVPWCHIASLSLSLARSRFLLRALAL